MLQWKTFGYRRPPTILQSYYSSWTNYSTMLTTIARYKTANFQKCMNADSPHHHFLREALPISNSMTFIDREGEKHILLLLLKHFNWDPLEKVFWSLLSHGTWNVNPTCQSFMDEYKKLLINNIVFTDTVRKQHHWMFNRFSAKQRFRAANINYGNCDTAL